MQGVNEIVKGAVSVKVAQDVASKTLSIQQDMLNIQAAMMTLQQENFRLLSELKVAMDALAAENDWKAISSVFYLRKLPAGDHVYVNHGNSGLSDQYVCPKCFEDRKIYTLKLLMSHRGEETYSCPTCDNRYKILPHGEPPAFVQEVYDPFSQIR